MEEFRGRSLQVLRKALPKAALKTILYTLPSLLGLILQMRKLRLREKGPWTRLARGIVDILELPETVGMSF